MTNLGVPTAALALASALLCTAVGCAPAPCPPAAVPTASPDASLTASAAATPAVATGPAAPPTPAQLAGLPELPRPSPGAEVKQRVGITDLQISYSSPAAKGRTIWGDLVPHGTLWRAGANAPTKLTVSRAFTFGGTSVPAGSYSLFILPAESRWTVILNKDSSGDGVYEHNEAEDVARVELEASDAPPRERLAYLFENATDDGVDLVLDWAGRRIAVPMTVATKEHVAQSMQATLDNAWRPLFNAGRYAFDSGDVDRALALLQQSIEIRATWWNHWWTAQVLAKKNQHASAREHAEKAMSLGEKDAVFQRAFAEPIKKALDTWPKG